METEKKEELINNVHKALEGENLIKTSFENIMAYLKTDEMPDRIIESIQELLTDENWDELNDRFHASLAFGTGGMRGRTIGKTVTKSERGKKSPTGGPEFAAVGTSTLNELTVIRATKALFIFIKQWMAEEGIHEQPRLVVAHDVRHFSVNFSDLVATEWTRMGGCAMKFDGPRSTPQLSFAVRSNYAHAGVVITASHNPFHDNGFKAYFYDGAQLVPPHANQVVENYNKITIGDLLVSLQGDKGNFPITTLPTSDDLGYRAVLEDAVLDPEMLKNQSLKLVFTPIHGTGAITAVPALWDHGVEVCIVDEQNIQDPNFSTVKSPNPENQEALKMGISVAKKTRSSLVLGSDPDSDRIGVAARDKEGKFHCLTGNQVACMLAEYRIMQLKRKQLLKEENQKGFSLLKTFVTSPLLSKIAQTNGISCINTPTGFKWMSQKLRKYEEQATIEIKEREGLGLDYDNTDLFARIDILSRYSRYVLLAAEESYGYLPVDLVRDKDGNASALAIAELFAFLNSSKSTAFDFLDSLYLKYGYHAEKTENIYFEGAEGGETINRLAKSYRNSPPTTVCDIKITGIKDFLQTGHLDEEEENLPLENFLIINLENEFSVAIRPSGTEPKIKYYIFGSDAKGSQDLNKSKEGVNALVDKIASWLVEDAELRVKS
ncbi:MAG: phospho-sugar mutase [Opitutales bacterium]|nr:phospho-sugar mutase [Opitutales bacterium]